MSDPLSLQVLLVEDDTEDLQLFERDFPSVFESRGIKVDLHSCNDFDDAFRRASNPLHRYDLIISDTYQGDAQNREAEVLRMVHQYQGIRFCPLVIYSSSVMPSELNEGAFLIWADKAKSGDIERAIGKLLNTQIPQLARKLHDELDRTAGSFLWDFLGKNWVALNELSPLSGDVLERIIRQRAAIQIGDIDPASGSTGLLERHAPEYYIYPAFEQHHFNLGDILRKKNESTDWRVILTPHCHLFPQRLQEKPRADFVLLARALPAVTVLGEGEIKKAKEAEQNKKNKKLSVWSRSPAQTDKTPAGRHWYLPAFFEIPHMYCDFLRVDSVPYDSLGDDFERIATLISPYAEALQSCFAGFYGAVGIPVIQPESIKSIVF